MIRNKIKIYRQIFASALIFMMFCAQIFSVVHFHHTHEAEDNLRIITSANHPNSENNNHNQHGSDDHHHHGDDHILGDWNYIKSVSNSSNKILFNDGLFSYVIFNQSIGASLLIVIDSNPHPPPAKFLLSIEPTRGPPAPLS